METFSFNAPKNCFEEEKWLLTFTTLEATNSVIIKTDENKSISNWTPGHWSSRGEVEAFSRLKFFLELRSQIDIELHVKKFEKEVWIE